MQETEQPTQIDRVVGAITIAPADAPEQLRARRRLAFEYLQAKLAPTDLGRRLGLSRFGSFADLRSSLPVHAPDEHLVKIEAALGFGPALTLGAAGNDPGRAEREELTTRWGGVLQSHRRSVPRRCFRLGVESDPALARWEIDDLAALMGSEGRLESGRFAEAAQCLDALRDYEADALVVPSLASISWLETHGRARLESLVPTLRVVFAQHDLDEPLRSRLPVLSQGILHPAGRLSLPALAGHQVAAGRLAWSSCLVELLLEEHAAKALRPRQDLHPILPEHAVLGERYELIVSSGTGFLRMRSGIYVRVVGFERLRDGPRLVPVPVFVPLPPPPEPFALEGVRLPGAILTAALRQAFEREDPALVAAEIGGADARRKPSASSRAADSGFFDGTELGNLGPTRAGKRPLGLELRVEVQGRSREDFPSRLAARFDTIVRRRSPAYDYLRERRELEAPAVLIVAGGSELRARKLRASRFRGTVARPQIRIASPT